jgi:hypothetical protein
MPRGRGVGLFGFKTKGRVAGKTSRPRTRLVERLEANLLNPALELSLGVFGVVG